MSYHRIKRALSRKTGQRKALLKALAVALVMKEKIQTSEPKAKELRPFIERLITQGKKGNLASYRTVIKYIGPVAGKKLFTDISPRYKDRKGGYTRITKLIARKGDGSARAYIELV